MFQLERNSLEFPPSSLALDEPNGLLAFGGDLSPQRLLTAYQLGIFPWFNPGQPILWWTPDPRTVFYPEQVHCSRSMRKFIRRSTWQVSIDRNFRSVIEACSQERANSSGTWITPEMLEAYNRLHNLGYAHSVEVWQGNDLVGGLYGVALGRVFFGESMFSRETNGSKMALLHLARFLVNNDFLLFDAQVASSHLFTLGATCISRDMFEEVLLQGCDQGTIVQMQSVWQAAEKKLISDDGHILD
ncbi:leucyl/phenylalanyl-tRNA--protein transferase [Saccharophagus sp. K07]|nr:leucyl/phenylalanyl-tRNA--protein transferase [Saccharophagus sp. K07]